MDILPTDTTLNGLQQALARHAELCLAGAEPKAVAAAVSAVRAAFDDYARWLMNATGWSAPLSLRSSSEEAGEAEPEAADEQLLGEDRTILAEVRYYMRVTNRHDFTRALGAEGDLTLPALEAAFKELLTAHAWRPAATGLSVDETAVDVWFEEE